ncbi:hypothetical protein, partial [Streptomyces sp. NPDC051014]|uniref:hypothetical protein n=1 Tax=Streptomyces sp. NPDC051014 TaxID=3155751 RepID=UPI0033FC500B
DVIIQMGFPGYFLVVADFILWAKNNGIAALSGARGTAREATTAPHRRDGRHPRQGRGELREEPRRCRGLEGTGEP